MAPGKAPEKLDTGQKKNFDAAQHSQNNLAASRSIDLS